VFPVDSLFRLRADPRCSDEVANDGAAAPTIAGPDKGFPQSIAALGLKVAAKANAGNRNTCAPAYPPPSKRAAPATCQSQTFRSCICALHRFAALDAAIARGIADVDADRVKPLSQVFNRLEAKYREAIDPDAERR
jgi:hypothetical protein